MSTIDDCEKAGKICPAWFVPRMMGDDWSFGLLLATGHVMCIASISKIHSSIGGEWVDVEMLTDCYWVKNLQKRGFTVIVAPTERLTASVQLNHIVAAFELADT